MAIATRTLAITQGNIDNSHIYLTEALDIFPQDVFGGPNESHVAPRLVRVTWGDESVETDIVKHIFRRRGWVSRFFSANQIKAGDQILLEQLDPYQYRVSKVLSGTGSTE